MNFSLNAKKRVPPQLQTLLRQRQIQQQQQQQQQQHQQKLQNIVKELVNTEVLPVIVEETVKDVITYDIGELSNDIGEPQPCVEEPVIETLSSGVVDDGANTNTGSQVDVLEVIEETVVETTDVVEEVEEVEEEADADAEETPEVAEAVTETDTDTDTKKKKKGKSGRK